LIAWIPGSMSIGKKVENKISKKRLSLILRKRNKITLLKMVRCWIKKDKEKIAEIGQIDSNRYNK
jgi:hypothetical protein